MTQSNYFDTPTKARVQAVCEFESYRGHSGFHAEVFRWAGVSHATGWRMLQSDPRRHHNNPNVSENRGPHCKITSTDIHRIETALQEQGWDARAMTWDELAENYVEIECTGRALQHVMHTKDFYKCVACTKGWVSRNLAADRVRAAEILLCLKPEKEDWRDVRFSDEVHTGWGPTGKPRILRQPGERYCKDCITQREEPEEQDKKRVHVWAAAGYNFYSPLVFYDAGNSNGKMKQNVYLNTILEPIVKPWIKEVQYGQSAPFILEEDRDSAHGTAESSIVYKWKEEHGLNYYFNAPGSPDLAPIENCWQPMKIHVRRKPHWDDQTIRELMQESWNTLQEKDFIAKRIDSMVERLWKVVDMEGQYIAD